MPNTTTSIRDVAVRVGVSVGTVSNVLNNPAKVSPKSLARVLAVIEELGYVRNDAARQLRAGRSTTIGLIRPPLTLRHPRQQQRRLDARGRVPRSLRGATGARRADLAARLARLRSRGTPAVLVDRMSDDERFIDFGSAAVVPLSSVRQPSQLIGRTAVQLLIEEEADSALSPRQVVFQPELVVRASTTASPSIPNSGGY